MLVFYPLCTGKIYYYYEKSYNYINSFYTALYSFKKFEIINFIPLSGFFIGLLIYILYLIILV